jgi:glycosyltransferase involved in cell wall biosynthesis
MRILIDAINDNAEPRGPDRYLVCLLREMAALAPGADFHVCHAPWQTRLVEQLAGPGVRFTCLDVPRRPLPRMIWHALSFARWANAQAADVIFLPNIILAFGLRAPVVMTVHDLLHFEVPEKFGRLKGRLQRLQIRAALRSPRRLIAVSDYTLAQMRRLLPGAVSRAVKITEGGPEPAAARPPSTDPPFFLFVGRVERSKGVEDLVDAFLDSALLRERGARLCIVGSPGNAEDALRRRLARDLAGQVERPGFLSEEELQARYARCTAFVFPSRAEGFGLVVLEAMARGAPVIAAEATSLPEVVGDAGVLVRAGDRRALREAMETLLEDHGLRQSLVARGFRRLSTFSWRNAGRDTLAQLEACAR